MTLEERIAELEAENAALREQVTVLAARLQELEARLAKDSHNSGKPPSSDGLARKTKSLRRRSGKKPGGQLGHRGETLHLVATPDAVVEHRPAICSGCQSPLRGGAGGAARAAPGAGTAAACACRSPSIRRCTCAVPACQAVSVGTFPAEAPSRAQYGPRLRALAVYLVEQQFVPYGRVRELLGDLFGRRLSVGTLVEWVQQAATTLAPVEAQIKAALGRRRCCTVTRPGCGRRAAGLGACGQHHAADALRRPRQARHRGDRRHRHLARPSAG